ncbi:MAG: BlaI/MecI/CopY family transcriptional regulator [Peptococcaceae bacterium]|nr:BlaI/MecI/CopY family transcriptional regulator [Peptococcaceae bacterium]
MKKYKLTEMETKFAEIIWAREPVPSGELVKQCEKEFAWKKSTTYTMLKKLENKGVFINKGGIVRALLKREEFYALQSEQFVAKTFGGSLPQFLAAFTKNRRLDKREIKELQRLIDEHRED